jgi:hypothetical protein
MLIDGMTAANDLGLSDAVVSRIKTLQRLTFASQIRRMHDMFSSYSR